MSEQGQQGQGSGWSWPSEGTWRNITHGAVALAVVLASLILVGPVVDAIEDSGPDAPTSLSGTTTVPAGERRVTVALSAEVTADTAASAGVVRRNGDTVAARVLGPTLNDPQFTVVLGRDAPARGATVEWKVAGLGAGGATGTSGDWSTEWVVVLALMLSSLVAALVAFAIAVRRRAAGADGKADVGPELASFLKVAALLMIAALALIAVMLATDEKSLTGLFALLGTIAGYLAGNRSETPGSGAQPPRRRRRRPNDSTDPDDPPEAMRTYGTRSLL